MTSIYHLIKIQVNGTQQFLTNIALSLYILSIIWIFNFIYKSTNLNFRRIYSVVEKRKESILFHLAISNLYLPMLMEHVGTDLRLRLRTFTPKTKY